MKKLVLLAVMALFLAPLANAQGKDKKNAGYVYFEDDMSWLTEEFGTTDVPVIDYVGTKCQYRRGLGWNKGVMAPGPKGTLKQSRWSNPLMPVYPTPVHMCIGGVELGTTNQDEKRPSNILSPKLCKYEYNPSFSTIPAQNGIEEGQKVDVLATITVTALHHGNKRDHDGVTVTVLNGGTINNKSDVSASFKIGTWNEWKDISFNIYGATSETQIMISNEIVTKLHRILFSGLKVEKPKKR